MKSAKQIAQAQAERLANDQAAAKGQRLPYPNPWDAVDPTKVSEGATQEELQASYQRWSQVCRKKPRKVHLL